MRDAKKTGHDEAKSPSQRVKRCDYLRAVHHKEQVELKPHEEPADDGREDDRDRRREVLQDIVRELYHHRDD